MKRRIIISGITLSLTFGLALLSMGRIMPSLAAFHSIGFGAKAAQISHSLSARWLARA